jgi:hypothetical protein
MNVHVTKMLSCLAVRYGGQRSVLTKPFWVQIAISVFHQDPKEQNASFKIIAMFTEVAEFHQVFTRFQKIPEVEKIARTSPKHSPGFWKFDQVFTKFLNFTRSSQGFENFTRFRKFQLFVTNFRKFTRFWKFHQVFTRFMFCLQFHRQNG